MALYKYYMVKDINNICLDKSADHWQENNANYT